MKFIDELEKNGKLQVSKIVHWVKVITFKTKDLGSIPETHMMY